MGTQCQSTASLQARKQDSNSCNTQSMVTKVEHRFIASIVKVMLEYSVTVPRCHGTSEARLSEINKPWPRLNKCAKHEIYLPL